MTWIDLRLCALVQDQRQLVVFAEQLAAQLLGCDEAAATALLTLLDRQQQFEALLLQQRDHLACAASLAASSEQVKQALTVRMLARSLAPNAY